MTDTEKKSSRQHLAEDLERWRGHARAFDVDACTARIRTRLWVLHFELEDGGERWRWLVRGTHLTRHDIEVIERFPSIGAALASFEYRLAPEQDEGEVLEEVG